jgi:cytochrome P450
MESQQRNFESLDYYTDPSLFSDPYSYYEFLRAKGPVQWMPGRKNVVAITGFEEALIVYQDNEHYSTINNLGGPLIPVPIPEGVNDDITPYIEAARPNVPMGNQLITFDNQDHSRIRSLLMRLFTPSRLKANEVYLTTLSGQLIDKFADRGEVEILSEYGNLFAGLVIADLLGVPHEDRPWFTEKFNYQGPVGSSQAANPLAFLDEKFSEYIADRRRAPRADVMSELATSTLSDGSLPTEAEVMRVATFLFAAGQDTTARFLAMCMHALAEHPDVQARLRADPKLIPNFIEEVLRFEGPVKTSHRMVRKPTTLAGVELPAGTNIALMQAAINRDPRRFEDPATFKLGRPQAREHLGFGRGAHTCPGALLARNETRVSLERLLARLGDIRISEKKHGPRSARRFDLEPTFILRGYQALHLEFTPIAKGV